MIPSLNQWGTLYWYHLVPLQIVSEWAQLPLARLFFALKVDEADWDGLSGTPNFHVLCPRRCPFMSFLDGRLFAKQTSWALPVMLTSRMLLHCSFANQACWFMFSLWYHHLWIHVKQSCWPTAMAVRNLDCTASPPRMPYHTYLELPVVRNYCSKLKQHYFLLFGYILLFSKNYARFHGGGFGC